MTKSLILAGAIISLFCVPATAQDASAIHSQKFLISSGFSLGYSGGLAGGVHGTLSNFTVGMPLSLRFSLGHSRVEPGKPAEAREIFINDATNGVPEQRGWRWDFGLDLRFPVAHSQSQATYAFFGPRYVIHTSNFKYVGGNEDFDVRSKQWGLGAGMEMNFGINRRFDLTLGGGIDHFFGGVLQGHDTSYSPDGEDVNPRKDFSYDDADEAVDQPKTVLRLMLGVNYYFR